ncbi:hypothetical protein chiPu_0027103, partial [Chiloscyllium punctatum]|nr:hypothetical protein [Chiloscyllium punctatum]
MTLALKSRCENLLKRRTSRNEQHNNKDRARKRLKAQATRGSLTREVRNTSSRSWREERLVGLCEIHFIPLVVGQRDVHKEQRLR